MIKIEKKVPIPSRRQGRKNLYPFASMKVGDSFEVPLGDRTSLGNAARQWAAREQNGFKFTTSSTDGKKIRIWRTA